MEERLRRIADVQTAVRLHNVPSPRFGGPTPAAARTSTSSSDDLIRLDPAALSPVSGRPVEPSPGAASTAPAAPLKPAGPTVWRRDRRWTLAAAGAAAAAVLAGTAAFAVNGAPWSGGDPPAPANTAAPTGSPLALSAPSSQATLSTVLPAGYKWYKSKSGFQVAWPAKWVKVQESRTSVTLCNPGGPPVVAVREWRPADPDVGVALVREEIAAGLPKYKRLRMEVSPQPGSAEWEYTFTDPKMGALHGLERVVMYGGRAYLVQWRTPACKWTENLSRFNIVMNSFRTAEPLAASRRNATPSGFVPYRSASGFQLAVPAKWTKIKESRTSVLFCAPGGPPLVGVRTWAPSNVDLAVALAREEKLAKLPRYRRVSLETLPGQLGAVWEYTFTDPKMGRLHGLERAFVTPTGAYLVQWRTPVDKWAANLSKLGVATISFSVGATATITR